MKHIDATEDKAEKLWGIESSGADEGCVIDVDHNGTPDCVDNNCNGECDDTEGSKGTMTHTRTSTSSSSQRASGSLG